MEFSKRATAIQTIYILTIKREGENQKPRMKNWTGRDVLSINSRVRGIYQWCRALKNDYDKR